MRAVAVEHLDAGAQRNLLAQNAQHPLPLDDAPPKRMLGLKADDQNRRTRVRRAMEQVMEDSPTLRHSRGGNDYHRPDLRVECL